MNTNVNGYVEVSNSFGIITVLVKTSVFTSDYKLSHDG